MTQSVFVRAFRAIERGEQVRTPRNWLIKIAHNEARRLLASRKLHAELPEHQAAEPEEHGRAEELRRAFDALPATQRHALVLRELEGRTYAEIAAALELSDSAVETLIFRARRSLREQLEGALNCEEFPGLLEDPAARGRVRAHARICPACATLERQARGRKGALRRIASSLGLPWWGAKVAAVVLTTATVAGVAVAVPREPVQRHPTVVPRTGSSVEQVRVTRTPGLAANPVAKPQAHPVAVPPRKGPGKTQKRVPAPLPAPPRERAPATRPQLTVLPGPEPPDPPDPAPDPAEPPPAPVPPPTKSVAAPQPAPTPPPLPKVETPALPAVPVAVPDPPPVALPAVTVPAPEVPPVTLPAVTVPTLPAPPPVPLPVAPPIVSAP